MHKHRALQKKSGGFLGEAREYIEKQEEKVRGSQRKQFAWFVLGFILFYTILSGAAYMAPAIVFEASAGLPLAAALVAQGNNVGTEACVLENGEQAFCMDISSQQGGAEQKQIIISWLCSGVLEIIILASAMLASFGVSWKKKFIGIAVAVPAGYVFNLLRVWVTANIILTQNVATIEFAHDLLFRAVLFVYITAFYVAWFYWAAKNEKR